MFYQVTQYESFITTFKVQSGAISTFVSIKGETSFNRLAKKLLSPS